MLDNKSKQHYMQKKQTNKKLGIFLCIFFSMIHLEFSLVPNAQMK